MNYSIIYHRYYVLRGTSPNYWGNRPSLPGEPLGRNTKASLVGELSIYNRTRHLSAFFEMCLIFPVN